MSRDKTPAQLAAEYEVHVGQITARKKQLLERSPALFEDGRSKRAAEDSASDEELYEQIGRLKMEVEWLKKLPSSAEELRRYFEPDHKQLTIVRQCTLLGLSHGIDLLIQRAKSISILRHHCMWELSSLSAIGL